jgi:hypothetical protein
MAAAYPSFAPLLRRSDDRFGSFFTLGGRHQVAAFGSNTAEPDSNPHDFVMQLPLWNPAGAEGVAGTLGRITSARSDQISTCSAMANASSTSMPR